ncbi:hypothetical protein BGZ67_006231 [Mortierella alpina]|nr:hypothetical protein BGZ67_006231 [Mortierella alpina]
MVGAVNFNLKGALERSGKDEQVENAFDSLVASGTVTAATLNDMAPRIKKCLKDVVRLASETKRICQRAVTVYAHRLSKYRVSEQGRRVLDKICGRISENDQDDDDDNNDADADDDKDRKPESEHKKAQETSAGVTITEIEDSLPPLRGDDAHVEDYVSRVKNVEATLVKFYSDDDRESWKRHKFYLKKAFDEEFRVVADSLLRMVGMVGGTSSAPREED